VAKSGIDGGQAPEALIILDNKLSHAELLVSSPKTTLKERA